MWKTSKRIRAVRKSEFKWVRTVCSIDRSSDNNFDGEPLAKRKKGAAMHGRLKRLVASMLHEKLELQEASKEKVRQLEESVHQTQLVKWFSVQVCYRPLYHPAAE